MEKQLDRTFISKELALIIKKYKKDLIFRNYQLYYGDHTPNGHRGSRIVSDFFVTQLPVPLRDWIDVARLTYFGGELEYREAIEVRNLVEKYFFKSRRAVNSNCSVISTYRRRIRPSLDILRYYPVYKIYIDRKNIEIVLEKASLSTWKVSVKSNKPLVMDLEGIVDTNERLKATALKHFPKEKIYGSYSEDNSKFTAKLHKNKDLEIFFAILKECVDNSK